MNYLLRSGHSWSGHERNNCFVNLGDGTYADISYLSGLGFTDDARGAGAVDWDGDGDLDLWLNNRSSPKARFMRNEYSGASRWVQLRLQSRNGNRDAIGARVRLRLTNGKALVRTVRAGVNYTIQSTKWLHFGLGADGVVESVEVDWPSGAGVVHHGISENARYLLIEDEPLARRLPDPPAPASFTPSTFDGPKATQVASVPIGSPIPLPPDLALVDFEGNTHPFSGGGGPTLVNFWASWCAGCMTEFAEFVDHRARLEDSGLRILACSVDKAEDREKAVSTAHRLGFWFPAGMVDPEVMNLLDSIKKVVLDKYEDLPLPSSLLLDRDGRIARIYLGPCDSEQLVRDLAILERVTSEVDGLYAASAYQSGRWLHPDTWLPAQKGGQLLKMTQFLVQDNRASLGAFYAGRLADYVAEVLPPENAARKAEGAVSNAAAALINTDPVEAIRLYRSILAVRPRSVPARVGLTAALLESGDASDRAEAAAVFAAVRPDMREPENAADLAIYGTTLYRLGNYEDALPYLERALETTTQENAFVRMCYGSSLIEVGRDSEGIEALKRSMKTLPQSAMLERRLATALDRAGQPDEAMTHYRRVIEMLPAPATIEEHAIVGHARFRFAEWDAAATHLSTVIGMDPDRVAERGMLGLALAHLGRDAEAIGHLEKVMPQLPFDPDSEFIYGIVLARTGNLDRAAASFEKILDAEPGATQALRSLALALDRLGRSDEAILRFEAYVEATPEDLTIRQRLAEAYERAGRPAEAVATYRAIVDTAPQVKFRLAWILASSDVDAVREGDEALRLAQQVAATADPKHPAVLDLLAAAYAECGRFDEAIASATAAAAEARVREQPEWAADIETRVALYREGKAFRKAS